MNKVYDNVIKFFKLMKLRGNTLRDEFYITISKILYLVNFIFKKLTHKPATSIGLFLIQDVIAKNSYGIFFCRKKEEDLELISDHYEYKTMNFFRKVSKGNKVVIDVGAHIGKYTVLAGKLSKGKVIAIEASKENFSILKKNIKLNKVRNVIAFNFAVSRFDGTVKLYKPDTSGHNTLKKIPNVPYEIVKSVSLDSFLRRLKIKKVDLIKIDVEGEEVNVIKGFKRYLSSHKVESLIIEIKNENLTRLRNILNSFGYSLQKIEATNYISKPIIKNLKTKPERRIRNYRC